MQMDSRVLVVGAGPVGLTMAVELARYGVPVRIVDTAAQRTDKSKALVLWSRTLELLDRLGCGEAFVGAGSRVLAVNITAGGRRIAHVAFDSVATPHPYALMLPQSETERLLQEQLRRLGVEVERQVELTRLASADREVAFDLRHADGSQESGTTDWLIGCDGAHSAVRHGFGMEFVGDTLPSDWILADVHLAGIHTPPSEMDMYWHADGVLALFPISPGRYRVIADVGITDRAARRPDPTLDEVQALVDRRGPGGITIAEPVWLAAFRINERMVASYRAGRVFLAGDAAHIHSPGGGQGMNTGMQDACNLAWKLALVCRGTAAPEPLLDSYSIERSAVGRQVLAATGRVTALAVMKGAVLQLVRNHVASLVFGLAPVRRVMANTLAEISIGYPESPLTRPGHAGQGGPAPGERAPVLNTDRPVGAGTKPQFVLFAEAGAAGTALVARHCDLLEQNIRPPFAGDGIWLVRPDGYVAVAAASGAWAEVGSYLDRIRGSGIDA
jgi:2-polyprenyl-6-methoxyphenol hydroxylase-like FAD-dependent oxidoreductase